MCGDSVYPFSLPNSLGGTNGTNKFRYNISNFLQVKLNRDQIVFSKVLPFAYWKQKCHLAEIIKAKPRTYNKSMAFNIPPTPFGAPLNSFHTKIPQSAATTVAP